MIVRVKICCIRDEAEAALAVRLGASALGLVSAMPSGPGPIPEEDIARIARTVPPGIETFLLTSLSDPAAIADQVRRCGTRVVQLVDRVPAGAHTLIRSTGVRVIQVIHVTGPESVEDAVREAETADGLLLDSGNPGLAVKELGGTGRTHDWSVSRRIVEQVDKPVYLAGGLTPGNVAEAIRAVEPYGVDLCSGVRADGRLDPVKLQAFLEAVASCR